MFNAANARVLFYSSDTGDSYEVSCCACMTGEDCKQVRGLSYAGADRLRVHVFVSRFQEMHNAFDYERDLLDAERRTSMLELFDGLRSVGISAYVDGLSWG